MKNKNLIIILMMLTITFTIMGGTLAYFTWQTSESQKTELTFTIDKKMSCSADIGGTISSNDTHLMPDSCTGTHAIKRTLTTRTQTINNNSIYMDLWLDINEIGTGLSNSNNFKYALTTSSTSCETGLVTSGTFTGTSQGDKIELLSSNEYNESTTNTYYLYIWLDSAETSTETQSQSFSLSLNGECSDTVPVTSKTLINNANSESLSYNDATEEQKTNMWIFSHPATDQTDALTDYRYIGSSPNNYIEFNNEVWRIVGVFNDRIKIMKEESIGSTYWDYKYSGVGSSVNIGSNDWTDSQLMYMLNPTPYALKSGYTYENNLVKDANGNIIYQTGCEPASISTSGTYNCTAKNWSLNETSLLQIEKNIYYLGVTYTNGSASDHYKSERSVTFAKNSEKSWNGYVGLIYISDYAYTFGNGVQNNCYNNIANCSRSISGMPNKSWMYKKITMYLISPDYMYNDTVACINEDGYAKPGCKVIGKNNIYPVVYLKQNIKLTGTGTSTDMYKIS